MSPNAELLIDFANSVDHDEGTDDLTTGADLARWLLARGLLERREPATAADLALARRLRDALHEALVGNHDGAVGWTALEAVGSELPLRVGGVLPTGRGVEPGLRPVRDGVPGAVSRILVAVNAAVADGSWPRVKICSADDCRWAYFDATKNRSRAWCEWGCGNKAKTRNYRARRRAAAGS
jgi:predicted RNA-binding Zn ribbon-like protein